MKIESTRHGDILVLRPLGALDATELPALQTRVGDALRNGVRHVVFDLAAVSLLPSTAVGVLIAAHRRVKGGGGRLVLANVPGLVRSTLTTMGVDQLFRFHPDVPAALAALGSA